mmetsp:Transcript_19363/g.23130  ORF Transcript_19363/g.23130 Transcript_19363/m.23130 type:complete len:321 (-) Transcript_19363:429-1391(-)|eukprot:CAMPEP_0197853734 /NCGR_PEP_ID=MMETSP1438-20131217/23298_1 /TAXON_ID=1461541 /ORGANISM="Pterosperma sp., Strain CCMP1384" /LENGTH=320 /DNA_ID=CAMNT_0043468243 /DNA_START=277 /DNA_END=1239 /DNA_ORIENTATION=+
MARHLCTASTLLVATLLSYQFTGTVGRSREQGDDCRCYCCSESTCPDMIEKTFLAGSIQECTAEACSSLFYACPDTGSHNDHKSQVRAEYFPDCECDCCREGECPELTKYTYHAGSADKCTPLHCRSHFWGCPDEGSHNVEVTQVYATYHDCTCECCTEEGSLERTNEDECSAFTHHTMYVGESTLCTPNRCRSAFYSCKDSGSHYKDFDVRATFLGLYSPPPPSPPPPSPPMPAHPAPAPIEKKLGEYAIVAIVVTVLVVTAVLVSGYVYYKRKRSEGYEWINMSSLTQLVGVNPAKHKGQPLADVEDIGASTKIAGQL